MPVIHTPRLQLRPLGPADEAFYCRLYADPAVMRHVAAPLSPEAASRAFRLLLRQVRQQPPRTQAWVIFERAVAAEAGLLALGDSGGTGETAELGTMVLPAHQRRGIAHEAQAALLDVVLDSHRLQVVWSRHAPANVAAAALKGKLGFLRLDDNATGEQETRWQMTRARWQAHGRSWAGMAEIARDR